MNNTKALTVPNQKRLEQLARDICNRYETAELLVKSAREKAQEAITEAILCGQACNEAKEILPHGAFGKWLGENCKSVCERTAQRYMKLSNATHVSEIKDAKSLRQAYITAGIIQDPVEPTVSASPTPQPAEPPAEPFKPKGESPEHVMRLRSDIDRESAMRDLSVRRDNIVKDTTGLLADGKITPADAQAILEPIATPKDEVIDAEVVGCEPATWREVAQELYRCATTDANCEEWNVAYAHYERLRDIEAKQQAVA